MLRIMKGKRKKIQYFFDLFYWLLFIKVDKENMKLILEHYFLLKISKIRNMYIRRNIRK